MKNIFILLLLAFPAVIFIVNGGSGVAYAQEEDAGDDMVDVEGEDSGILTEEEPDEEIVTSSSDADTTILFIEPVHNPLNTLELPGGVPVEFLIGFTNKGESDFVVETVDTSFRYPMDFNFYIQNFSTVAYNKVVKPNHEATLAYSFVPSETFAGRPFGLNVNLNYRDANGNTFTEAVYNETVQIIELDEGLDGETVFLYMFLAACVILTLVGGQQLLSSFGRKSRSSSSRKAPVEMGTSNPDNIDYSWVPEGTLRLFDKSQKSPKQSPRQRKAKRAAGSDD